jgi:hypothetical protein
MKECKVINCNKTDLVYSGISALMLGGIPTETYCYSCGNAYNQIQLAIAELIEKANA